MTDDGMKRADYLKGLLEGGQENRFRLTWEGSKIPRGGAVDGVEIAWTQHGMITGVNRENLGYYTREEEFGGESGKRHVMVISTRGSEVTPPDCGSVEKLPSKEIKR